MSCPHRYDTNNSGRLERDQVRNLLTDLNDKNPPSEAEVCLQTVCGAGVPAPGPGPLPPSCCCCRGAIRPLGTLLARAPVRPARPRAVGGLSPPRTRGGGGLWASPGGVSHIPLLLVFPPDGTFLSPECSLARSCAITVGDLADSCWFFKRPYVRTNKQPPQCAHLAICQAHKSQLLVCTHEVQGSVESDGMRVELAGVASEDLQSSKLAILQD